MRKLIVLAASVAALIVVFATGCASESSAPEGAKSGGIKYDCSSNCGDDLARDRLKFKDVWCRWQGDHVVVHVRVENPLVVPTKTSITPAYEIEDGGMHGTSFGSDRSVPARGDSYTAAEIDAGSPEGVPTGTTINSCEPQVQGMDAVDEVDTEGSDDVEILSTGDLDG